jgi:hypothetical protein
MASGDTLMIFSALHNEPPATAYATLDTRNNHPVVDFDAAAVEDAVFGGVLPRNYAGGGVTVVLHWTATSATSGDVKWNVQVERMDTATDLDADSFAAAQTTTTTTSATSGAIVTTSIALTNGAQMDSLAVGEGFRLKVTRDATAGGDTMTGDAELHLVEVKET